MHVKKRYCCFVTGMLWLVFFLFSTGCYKDYSYERQPADTIIRAGNVIAGPSSSCAACNSNTVPDSSWRATIDGVVYCGNVVKPVTLPERTAFTFFGPSFCSADSGFVASVFLRTAVLDGDKADLNAEMSCYYYDKVAPAHVYISSSAEPLNVLITSYDHRTGVTTGTFRGVVFDAAARRKEVKNGRFRIRL